jgi:cell division transport system ATP-binding protein
MSDQPVINLTNAVIYQDEMLVLNDVNFTVNSHEFVYLLGKTGSGKSSLLKVMYGDLNLAGGAGSVCGFDLMKLTSKQIPQLRRKLGIVFQDFQLLMDRSVDENLRFVLKATGWTDKAKMNNRVAEVLKMVGLITKDFKMPHELSGGEQQRVVIARALLNHPVLMLADEPTGNLDPQTSDEIIRLLMEISKETGMSVIMASHDYLTIQKFPARSITCEDGRVIELNQTITETTYSR